MKQHAKKCASWGESIALCNCDSYHTFDELYEHRIELFLALMRAENSLYEEFGSDELTPIWKAKAHSDGSVMEGWFIAGIGREKGEQITYHLPMSKWDKCYGKEQEKAPEFDGHTPDDVLKRLAEL